MSVISDAVSETSPVLHFYCIVFPIKTEVWHLFLRKISVCRTTAGPAQASQTMPMGPVRASGWVAVPHKSSLYKFSIS